MLKESVAFPYRPRCAVIESPVTVSETKRAGQDVVKSKENKKNGKLDREQSKNDVSAEWSSYSSEAPNKKITASRIPQG